MDRLTSLSCLKRTAPSVEIKIRDLFSETFGSAAALRRVRDRMHADSKKVMHRRAFLGLGAFAAAAALVPSRAAAATVGSPRKAPERALSFFNTHTGERLQTIYCRDGCYQSDALKNLDYILRDFRA